MSIIKEKLSNYVTENSYGELSREDIYSVINDNAVLQELNLPSDFEWQVINASIKQDRAIRSSLGSSTFDSSKADVKSEYVHLIIREPGVKDFYFSLKSKSPKELAVVVTKNDKDFKVKSVADLSKILLSNGVI